MKVIFYFEFIKGKIFSGFTKSLKIFYSIENFTLENFREHIGEDDKPGRSKKRL